MFQFDYRILHRGTANKTSLPRPVYVLTFGKSWYKDTLNYPHRSVFGKRTLTTDDDISDSSENERNDDEVTAENVCENGDK